MSKVNLPILYSQWDTRWDGLMLGFNKVLPFNIHNYGCLLCCWAMCDKYFGKDTDPARLNEMYKSMGEGKAFDAGGNYIPGGNNLAYGDIKEARTATPTAITDAQFGEIRTALDNGYPVIIGIDVNPRTVAYDSHFVTVTDYNINDENDLEIADPLGGRTHSLKDYLGFLVPNARKTIYSYIIVTGPKPKLTPETIPVTKVEYAQLTKNNDQWAKIVEYLKPGADPNNTPFVDLQTVIAGIKSRATDLENKVAQANIDRDLALKEVENQKDKLANTVAACQRDYNQLNAEYTALKQTVPDIDKLRGSYEARITEVEGQLREAQKQIGLRDLEITQLKSEAAVGNAWQKLINWITGKIK